MKAPLRSIMNHDNAEDDGDEKDETMKVTMMQMMNAMMKVFCLNRFFLQIRVMHSKVNITSASSHSCIDTNEENSH